MKFEVLKEFTFNGKDLVRGDIVEIPDESTKIGSLTRSRFIRYAGDTKAPELPTIKEVAREMVTATISAAASEEQPAPRGAAVIRGPKEIVREAKAKAAVKGSK